MLGSVVEALQSLNGPELELQTSILVEEVRGLAGGGEGGEFAAGLVARVTGAADLHATTDQRRATARFLDAAVELAGAGVVTRDCAALLLQSAGAGVAAKAESVVAAEVLLGVLGATGGDGGAAWEAVFAEARRKGVAALRLLVDALERFPGATLPQIAARLGGADRLLALELLGAAGLRAAPLGEAEAALRALPPLFEAARTEKEPRVAAAALLAATGLLRAVSRRALQELLPAAAECLERGLAWAMPEGAPAAAAAAALFFLLYAVVPGEALRRLSEWSGRAPAFAAAARRMLEAASLPLHPALLGAEEEPPDALADESWSALLAGVARPPPALAALPAPQQQPAADEDWLREVEAVESQLALAAVATDALCARAGLRLPPLAEGGAAAAAEEREARAAAVLARTELLFERLQRAKTVARMRHEGPPTVSGGGGGGGGFGATVSSTDPDTSETEQGEEAATGAPRSETATARLKSLLASARAEAAARELAEEGLRRRLHQAEAALRAERDGAKAARAAAAAAAVVATDERQTAAAEEQEQRIGELEARLAAAEGRLRGQQQYEAELAQLQYDAVEWDAAGAAARARLQDGTDPASQLMAARAEARALEEAVLEAQAHHGQALAEMAGLTAVTNAALSESLRAEREVEDLRRTMNKMMDACQERIAAVEDKYASLQELHAGLLSELSRRK